MRNIFIKYIISFPDYENAIKEQQDNVSAKSECEMLKTDMEARLRHLKHSLFEPIKIGNVDINSCLWTAAPKTRWALYR